MNKEPSKEDKQASERLYAAWMAKKKQDSSFSQNKLGEVLGMTQGAVSMYLNGTRPVGLEALIAFCVALDVDPLDIYPEKIAGTSAQRLSNLREFVTLFDKAPASVQAGIISILRSTNSTESAQ